MRVAILGFGRFGRALGELVTTVGGAELRALDPHAEIPLEIAATSLANLVDGATHVIVAVPVSSMHGALRQLAPHLTSEQLVIDVGSVKGGPSAALAAVLGDRVPYVATHPLFGPVSLARREHARHVVVCPNQRHPAATARARAFYEELDCGVLEMAPDEHDRWMARTHALAFFIAKGMLGLGAAPAPFAPPSYQGIARAIEAVRSDGGHLFRAIQQENPFAADARKELLESLTSIDAELTLADDGAQDSSSFAIPALGVEATALRETRGAIDQVDRGIVDLLARRAALAEAAWEAKEKIGHGVTDAAREAEVLTTRRRWAEEHRLDGPSIDEVFQAILRFSRRIQRRR